MGLKSVTSPRKIINPGKIKKDGVNSPPKTSRPSKRPTPRPVAKKYIIIKEKAGE